LSSKATRSGHESLPLFDASRTCETKKKSEDFIDFIRQFNQFGQETKCYNEDSIPYFVNEFWTSGQRGGHSIHEISYRACFKAELPEFFIDLLSGPGDVVLDPFMGRGTTPVQASLMGRAPFGSDINPLSSLLTRPRLRPIAASDVSAALETIDWQAGEIERKDLLAFYHPETLRGLESLRLWINQRAPIEDPCPDPIADWVRMVSINRLSGHSPGFFSGRSMPPNQAVSIKAQLRINEKLGVSPPKRDIAAIIRKKTKSLLRDGKPPVSPKENLAVGPAWLLNNVADNSVTLTVTSPPFLDIVQYASDNWLRCWFAGIDPSSVDIAMHRTEAGWMEMVHRVLIEQARVLRSGGHVAFEVGEVRGGSVLLEKLVWEAADGSGLERICVVINSQNFTKTANCWGVDNGKMGTNTNRIVILRKP
jgi:hypothetical protein